MSFYPGYEHSVTPAEVNQRNAAWNTWNMANLNRHNVVYPMGRNQFIGLGHQGNDGFVHNGSVSATAPQTVMVVPQPRPLRDYSGMTAAILANIPDPVVPPIARRSMRATMRSDAGTSAGVKATTPEAKTPETPVAPTNPAPQNPAPATPATPVVPAAPTPVSETLTVNSPFTANGPFGSNYTFNSPMFLGKMNGDFYADSVLGGKFDSFGNNVYDTHPFTGLQRVVNTGEYSDLVKNAPGNNGLALRTDLVGYGETTPQKYISTENFLPDIPVDYTNNIDYTNGNTITGNRFLTMSPNSASAVSTVNPMKVTMQQPLAANSPEPVPELPPSPRYNPEKFQKLGDNSFFNYESGDVVDIDGIPYSKKASIEPIPEETPTTFVVSSTDTPETNPNRYQQLGMRSWFDKETGDIVGFDGKKLSIWE